MTRRSLKNHQALLVGRLFIYERATNRQSPAIGLEVTCPYCHDRKHVHGWSADAGLNDVSHRSAHCVATSPLEGYFVGLDPNLKEANKQTLAQFKRQVAFWESRQPQAKA